MLPPRSPLATELAVTLAILLLLLFLGPIARWWASPSMGWLTPYGLWLVVILGAVLIHRRSDADEP